jgi:hypothetical protein
MDDLDSRIATVHSPGDLAAFTACVAMCFDDRDLVAAFDRLRGCNLLGRGTPLDLMIDEATGRTDRDLRLFVEFVHDVVWSRMSAEARAELAELAAEAMDAGAK